MESVYTSASRTPRNMCLLCSYYYQLCVAQIGVMSRGVDTTTVVEAKRMSGNEIVVLSILLVISIFGCMCPMLKGVEKPTLCMCSLTIEQASDQYGGKSGVELDAHHTAL